MRERSLCEVCSSFKRAATDGGVCKTRGDEPEKQSREIGARGMRGDGDRKQGADAELDATHCFCCDVAGCRHTADPCAR